MDSRLRIVLSVAIIGFVSGVVGAAWTLRADEPLGTHAGLFSKPIVDLVLEREGGVNGFIGLRNLAFGDRTSGTIRVVYEGSLLDGYNQGAFDLDFDVRGDLRGATPGSHRLDEVLFITRLSYGRDDLLSRDDGGADLISEIDGDPVVGNGDGRLTFRELGKGKNDLPAPKARDTGGTPFHIEVEFDPPKNAAFEGQEYRVTFVFQLSDAADADLN